jgi:hypothetical protein
MRSPLVIAVASSTFRPTSAVGAEIEFAKASQIRSAPCKLYCCGAWTVMLNIAGEAAASNDDGSASTFEKSHSCPFHANFFPSECDA